MSRARRSERVFGKSDAIDALAVARAALREPDLPVVQLAGPEREIALLLDHRADLVVERTRLQARIRWLLFELDPTLYLAGARWMTTRSSIASSAGWPSSRRACCCASACELLARIYELTRQIRQLERDLRPLVRRHAASLLALPGIGALNAARIHACVADVRRLKTEARLALSAGVAPLDASSGRQRRHRLNRSGNRQLNAALHMIALTQARVHAPAREYLARRRERARRPRSHPRPQMPPHPHPSTGSSSVADRPTIAIDTVPAAAWITQERFLAKVPWWAYQTVSDSASSL